MTDDELRKALTFVYGSKGINGGLHLALYTGCRIGQALGANWAEMDWENKVWRIPHSRRKTRRHAAPRDFLVPMNSLTFDLLRREWDSQGKPTEGLVFKRKISIRPFSHQEVGTEVPNARG